MSLLVRNARVLTMSKLPRPRRGNALGELGVLPRADVIIDRDKIVAVGNSLSMPPRVRMVEADGRVLMPGFIDCHTHACWAGERLGEWQRRMDGESYLEILKSGGGIMSTVTAVRSATQKDLAKQLRERLDAMLACGTTTAEVKSGYGLTTEDEIKMLEAIHAAGEDWKGTLVPTALLGHAMEPGDTSFVDRTVKKTLPEVTGLFPGVTIDAYCEQGAWSVRDAGWLLETAKAAGHPVRVHADQFNSLGMIPEALRIGALSVDHLEASEPKDLEALAKSNTYGTVMPACGFHLNADYAPAREFVDMGGLLALATNYNPGSAPCPSIPMAIALAVRHCGLTPAEAIAASTINAATLLGFSDRGAVLPGQRADLVLLRHRDERELAFEFGGSPCDVVVCGGEVVYGRRHVL